MKKLLECSICKTPILPHPISGWAGGNNAEPVNDGRCCDDCNISVVIPERLALLVERAERKKGSAS